MLVDIENRNVELEELVLDDVEVEDVILDDVDVDEVELLDVGALEGPVALPSALHVGVKDDDVESEGLLLDDVVLGGTCEWR